MPQNKSSLRAVIALLAVGVTIAGVVLAVYLDYFFGRRQFLTNQHATVVAGVAARLSETIAATTEVVRTQVDTACRPGAGSAGKVACPWPGADGASAPAGVSCTSAPSARRATGNPAAGIHLQREGNDLVAVLEHRCEGAAHGSVHVRMSIGQILQSILEAEGLSQLLLLTTSQGDVVWRRFPETDVVRNVLDLLPPSTAARPALVPGRIVDVDYVGTTHHLLVAPLPLPWPNATLVGAPEGSSVMLCGLVSDAGIQSAALAVPHLWLLAGLLVLLLIGLLWPLLKLRYIGPRERLRAIDVALLVLCGILGAGVLTAGALGLRLHAASSLTRDDQLQHLATEANRRLGDEIARTWGLLRSVAIEGDRPVVTDNDEFENIFITGDDGSPTARWLSKPRLENGALAWDAVAAKPPRLRLSDRGYYRDVRRRHYWSLGRTSTPEGIVRGFAVEPVRSRLTGDVTLVLATAMHRDPGPKRRVALIGIRPKALTNPILPPDIALMTLDAGGSVQLHSDATRSLRENLLVACGLSTELATALQTRRAQHLDATCYGGRRRLYVMPLAETPWSIAVVADPARLQTVDVEIVATWFLLFGSYFAVLVGFAVTARLLHGRYRAPWLWPSRPLTTRYLVAGGRLLITAVVTAWLVPRVPGLAAAVPTVTLPAVAVALLCLTQGVALSANERRVARFIAVMGGLVLLTLMVATRDWVACAVLLATAFVWASGAFAHRRWARLEIEPGMAIAATAVVALALASDGHGLAAAAMLTSTPPLLAFPLRRWLTTTENGFRFAYVSMLSALLLAVAVVPSAVCFRDAAQYVHTAFARATQLELMDALVARGQRLRDQSAGGGLEPALAEQVDTQRLRDRADVYDGDWLGWPTPPSDTVTAERPPFCPEPPPACPRDDGAGSVLSHWVLPLLPVYDPLAVNMRRATCGASSDGGWCWHRASPEAPVSIDVEDAGTRTLLGPLHTIAGLQPPPPPQRPWRTAGSIAITVIPIGAVVLLAFAILASVARRIFLLDVDRRGTVDDGEAGGDAVGRRVFVFTLRSARAGIGIGPESPSLAVVDLRAAGRPTDVRALATWAKNKPAMEIDHLEVTLHDPEWATQTLDLVKALLDDGKEVILTSEVDPLIRLAAADRDAAASIPAAERAGIEAWASVLSRFSTTLVPLGGPAGSDGATLAERYDGRTCDETRSDHENDDQLHGRNRHLWMQCTHDEQLVLRQLADEGFLNPNNSDLERDLFRRRLIRRTPAFALLDRSFHRFVERAASARDVRAWEQELGLQGWSRLRGPLLGLVALACAFFFVTQRAAFDSAIGTASAVGASLPVFLRMLGMLRDGKGNGVP